MTSSPPFAPPSSATYVHLAVLQAELRRVSDAHQRLEIARNQGTIRPDDLRTATEGLLLRSYVSFEEFARSLFFDLAMGKAPHKRASSLFGSVSRDQLVQIYYGERKYLEWLPLKRTEDRVSTALRDERLNPFYRLRWRRKTLSVLNMLTAVRNRIAHSSEEAATTYGKVVSSQASHYHPGDWLLDKTQAVVGPTGSMNNLLACFAVMGRVGEAVGTTKPDLDRLLGTTEAAKPGDRGVPGKYRCTLRKTHTLTLKPGDDTKLPACNKRPECQDQAQWLYLAS